MRQLSEIPSFFLSHKNSARWSSRFVQLVPRLSNENAIIAIRRLFYLKPNCRVWAILSHAYLKKMDFNCDVRFSSRLHNDKLMAHAFLKFSDGSTIGEHGGLVELY